MKNKLIVFFAILLLISQVSALEGDTKETDFQKDLREQTGVDTDGSGSFGEGGNANIDSANVAITPDNQQLTDVQDTTINPDGDITQSGQMQHGPVQLNNANNVDPTDGSTNTESSERVTQQDQGFNNQFSGVEEGTFKHNGDFEVKKTESAIIESDKAGTISLTNGEGIKLEGDTLTIQSADMAIVGDNIFTLVQQMTSQAGVVIDVIHSDSVIARCVKATDVEDATFTLNDGVDINAIQGSQFDIQVHDTKFDYRSLSDSSQFNTDCRGNYELADTNITLTKATTIPQFDRYTENIITDGTALIELTSLDGVLCADFKEGTGMYIVRVDPERDYAFNVPQAPHKICTKKAVAQRFDCKDDCTLMDWTNRSITSAGVVDYLRNNVKNGTPGPLPNLKIYSGTQQNAQARLKLDTTFLQVDNTIRADAPIIISEASDYIQFQEKRVNGETHRLIKINEKLKDASTSFVNDYTTAYSGAKTNIVGNDLTYIRGNTTVKIYRPNNPKINIIKEKLNQQAESIFLGLTPLLLLFFPRKKKGQLTIFIVLGVLIVIVVGALLLGFQQRIGTVEPPPADVSQFVESCLKDSTNTALNTFGRHGGTTLQNSNGFNVNYWYKSRNRVPTKEQAQEQLKTLSETKLVECMDGFNAYRKLNTRVTEDQIPAITVTIGPQHTLFELSYAISIQAPDQDQRITQFDPVIAPIRLEGMLTTAHEIVESQINNDNLIDLDMIGSYEVEFFPYEADLITVIWDGDYGLAFAHER